MGQKGKLVRFLAAYGVIGIAVILIYYPGLNGPFVFDDIPNITNNPAIQISSFSLSSLYSAAITSPSSVLGRPLAGLSFAIDYLIVGNLSSAFVFKLTNLVIHLINTALVYWFVFLLTQLAREKHPTLAKGRWPPFLATALWALHPLQLTSVLYVVQRMTSLSALFLLLGMIMIVYGRQYLHEQKPFGMSLMVAGWIIGLVLGMGSKETSALILLYIPIIEYLFFSRADFHSPTGVHLRTFYGLAIVLPLLLMLGWFLTHAQFLLQAYNIRDFDMTERLLTEPRILWFYLYLLFIPNISEFSLYHDDILVSTGLFTPWTTFPAIFGLMALVLAAFLWRKKYPVFSFAVLWFIAGHCLESTFLPLELAHEHRNYLPVLGPVVGVAYALDVSFRNRNRIYLVLGTAIVIALAAVTFLRSETWATEESLITTMARTHPLSARSQAMLAELYADRKNDLIQAQRYYEIAAKLEPNEIGHVIRMLINAARISTRWNANRGEKSDPTTQRPFNSVVIPTQVRDQLKENLSNKPLTPTTRLTLDELASCIAEIPFECRDLYPNAVEWYRWALGNPNIPRDLHKAISIYLFRISTAQRDYSVALTAAINARSYDPADISFILMEADARIALHQFDQAEDILLRADRNSIPLPPDTLNDINILLTKIRTMRANSNARRLN